MGEPMRKCTEDLRIEMLDSKETGLTDSWTQE